MGVARALFVNLDEKPLTTCSAGIRVPVMPTHSASEISVMIHFIKQQI
jgi:hypothetical protein